MLKESYHLLQLDYEKSLSENRKMISTIEEQYVINYRYFTDRQKLDWGVVDFENEIGVFAQKVAVA